MSIMVLLVAAGLLVAGGLRGHRRADLHRQPRQQRRNDRDQEQTERRKPDGLVAPVKRPDLERRLLAHVQADEGIVQIQQLAGKIAEGAGHGVPVLMDQVGDLDLLIGGFRLRDIARIVVTQSVSCVTASAPRPIIFVSG